jgi:uncharacterized membrane protein required for colicin V production
MAYARARYAQFDIIVFAVVGILTIIGLWKGFVRQLFGLLGVVAGYMLAMSLNRV